jgi:transcriptional regulator with XRE-family HTH domain
MASEPQRAGDPAGTAGSGPEPRTNGVDVLSEALGATIRGQRLAAGLSVRGLAARTNVSPSLISQIERGRARPSVATLFAIAAELGLPVAQLFSEAQADSAGRTLPGREVVQRHETRKAMTLDQGVRWERLTFEPDDEVDFVYLDYPPGASSSPDGELKSHGGREFGYVLSGSLRVRIGPEEHLLRPNDSISFESTTPHELIAEGSEPMRAVWIVVNRRGDPRTTPLK